MEELEYARTSWGIEGAERDLKENGVVEGIWREETERENDRERKTRGGERKIVI